MQSKLPRPHGLGELVLREEGLTLEKRKDVRRVFFFLSEFRFRRQDD